MMQVMHTPPWALLYHDRWGKNAFLSHIGDVHLKVAGNWADLTIDFQYHHIRRHLQGSRLLVRTWKK
ncbi:hypothetical protein WJX77_012510 [Trebouxia sp. C0004]